MKMTNEQFRELLIKAQAGDNEAMTDILEMYMPLINKHSYVNGKLDLYSGNDDQIVPLMSLGGKGVISVVSNILPAKTVEMAKKCLEGDYRGAAQIQYDLHAVIDSLFSEVNPIPVKAATAKMGFGVNTLRLPLTPMSQDKYEKMLTLMREQGLNV